MTVIHTRPMREAAARTPIMLSTGMLTLSVYNDWNAMCRATTLFTIIIHNIKHEFYIIQNTIPHCTIIQITNIRIKLFKHTLIKV